MGNLRDYANDELTRANLFGKDSIYEGILGKAVMALVELFEAQGHSGASAMLTVAAFSEVAMLKPLTPLTGDDDEWEDFGGFRQNKRCGSVFKTNDGEVFDSHGKVFMEPDGTTYTSSEGTVLVTFPYMPKTEYVSVEAPHDNEGS